MSELIQEDIDEVVGAIVTDPDTDFATEMFLMSERVVDSFKRTLVPADIGNNFKLPYANRLFLYESTDSPVTDDSNPYHPCTKVGEAFGEIHLECPDGFTAQQLADLIDRVHPLTPKRLIEGAEHVQDAL